ncbi:MAG TPA: glycosyltransferase family 4 protein [Pyrinomonadaceae bacterium]|nr:glycosyltransferase family 4 protein [Pyrinomonadaceae bacterium]
MKILIGMPDEDSWGGPAASEPPFVDALHSLGVDVATETYVYGDKNKPTPLFSRVSRVIQTALRFRRRTRDEKFDLIHLNTAFDRKTVLRDAVSIFLMRPRRTHVFLKIHGSGAHEIPVRSRLFRPLIKYLTRHVDGLGVHTKEEVEDLKAHGFTPSKFYMVKNAIEIEELIPKDFKRVQKDSSECFELLFISRFIKAKGLIETINAGSLLHERGVKFKLACVGDGPIRGEAEDLVRSLDLENHVEFTGYATEKEVLNRLLTGDIFVFPTTHTEGFPNILFRSVAVGLPIVTTPVRAAAEYLSEPENCLFCTPEPDNIADKLETIINDRSLRDRMSESNRQFGRLLTKEVIAKEFLEVYQKICSPDFK